MARTLLRCKRQEHLVLVEPPGASINRGHDVNADLEQVVRADEEARARVAAAREGGRATVDAARDEAQQRRSARHQTLVGALEAELRAIAEQSEREAQERARRRAAWMEERRRAGEESLERGIEAYLAVVCPPGDGP